MLVVVNYADGNPYEGFRMWNTWSAKHLGRADYVWEYSRNNIPQKYIEEHKTIFSYKRGAGLWLWKPYVIWDALSKLRENDWLFYCDSGSVVIRSIHHLISCAEENRTPILLVEQPLLNRQFTKRETIECMGLIDNNENQLLGGYVLVKKCDKAISIIEEWLRGCEHEDWLSPNHFHPEIEESADFFSHREDQSVLTNIAIKRNLPVFRDPSDFGEFPHMYYCSNYSYQPKVYKNSKYPTIILANRRCHPLKYGLHYLIKKLLAVLGLIDSKKIIEVKKAKGL